MDPNQSITQPMEAAINQWFDMVDQWIDMQRMMARSLLGTGGPLASLTPGLPAAQPMNTNNRPRDRANA